MTPAPRQTLEREDAFIGRRVLLFDSLPSTNDVALHLAEPGTAVVADTQTAGRGQYHRTWHSAPGASLLMSVTIAPPPALNRAAILTAWAGVAVCEAIAEFGMQTAELKSRVRLKWPNDVLIDGRKVAGILVEQRGVTVVGIGLNVNQTEQDFHAAALPDATSLHAVTGHTQSVMAVRDSLLKTLNDFWLPMQAGDFASLQESWIERLQLLKREVTLTRIDGSILNGRLLDLTFHEINLATSEALESILPDHVRGCSITEHSARIT
jgi:BirA family biotin operon repressor/biotin-[acetyl-CoA-carboxylase] ligase